MPKVNRRLTPCAVLALCALLCFTQTACVQFALPLMGKEILGISLYTAKQFIKGGGIQKKRPLMEYTEPRQHEPVVIYDPPPQYPTRIQTPPDATTRPLGHESPKTGLQVVGKRKTP